MSLRDAVGQFFTPDGQVVLPDEFSLAGACETLFQMDVATGNAHRHVMRYWDYSESTDGVAHDFDRTQVNIRIKAVAARLQQVGTVGDRVAILMGNSPEYVFGFVGAMYAGMTPVPLYDPTEPGHADHLSAVLADCQPRFVLTNSQSAAAVRRVFAATPAKDRPRILAVDALPDSLAASWAHPLATEAGQKAAAAMAAAGQTLVDQVAFLQYTSGSTRVPAGVKLTHRSVMTNALQIFVVAQFKEPARMVSWLPMHHSMGAFLALMFTVFGMEMDVMTPRDFIQQPSRFLRHMSRRGEADWSYTAVPNFALDLMLRYAHPEDPSTLDLSNIDNLILGAEPVSAAALDAFAAGFADCGFARHALRPSFGQTEASLLLTTPNSENRPVILTVDRESLTQDTLVEVDEDAAGATRVVSCGQPLISEHVIIVNPETRAEVGDGHVGEIWARGANMAAGYLNREDETQDIFHNTLVGVAESGSRAGDGAVDAQWLATGDLGCFIDNELFITGRRKELIVIAGRNHYPMDIECTVFASTRHVRPGCAAAFSVPGDDNEKLVIFAERDPEADPSGDAAAVSAIRQAVIEAHGITPDDIQIVDVMSIPRSSSGKLARRVAAKRYLER